jgi:hypothetical protein
LFSCSNFNLEIVENNSSINKNIIDEKNKKFIADLKPKKYESLMIIFGKKPTNKIPKLKISHGKNLFNEYVFCLINFKIK